MPLNLNPVWPDINTEIWPMEEPECVTCQEVGQSGLPLSFNTIVTDIILVVEGKTRSGGSSQSELFWGNDWCCISLLYLVLAGPVLGLEG